MSNPHANKPARLAIGTTDTNGIEWTYIATREVNNDELMAWRINRKASGAARRIGASFIGELHAVPSDRRMRMVPFDAKLQDDNRGLEFTARFDSVRAALGMIAWALDPMTKAVEMRPYDDEMIG